MPGILPMKLIKCGNSQTRIAQACDRCRSKKIRCDGIRPCCTQCANVGFECKTSDKLSRRAFPRGYTESLEERVRTLEGEIRELKALLDAKDEQLDILNRIHSFSPYTPPPSASAGGLTKRQQPFGNESPKKSKDEVFSLVETMRLMGLNSSQNGYFMGASSGRPFLDMFKRKLLESRRFEQNFNIDAFLVSPSVESLSTLSLDCNPTQQPIKAPPRLLSDHLLVSYFQEHHPLFPVIHRPTFLRYYEKLVKSVENGNPGAGLPKHAIAQLFLVFAISSEQTNAKDNGEQISYDAQWQQALHAILMDCTIETLQCLVLAQVYCFAKGDYDKLLQYKALAVGISLRLGLNQCQKKFNLSALNCEMRKRVFWCNATLDSFSAATLGLPRLLREEVIEAEYPADVDDEYVSDKGFLPTIPGDSTKISSALALFRIGAILGKVLENVYCMGEKSVRVLREVEDELEAWKNNLAPHLRLEFVNGSPATNIVHSRSPLLILAYHYTRSLIHRSVIGCGLSNESSSLIAVADSSKCIIQIISLLSERRLGFSFCLNRNTLLLSCGFSLLYAALDYQQDGGLFKDTQKLVNVVLEELERDNCLMAKQFRIIAKVIVNIEPSHVDRRASVSSAAVPEFTASPASTIESQDDDQRHYAALNGSPDFRNMPANLPTRSPLAPQKFIRRSSSQDVKSPRVLHGAKRVHRLTSASLTDLVPPYSSIPQKCNPSLASNQSNIYDSTWGMDAPIANDEWAHMLSLMDSAHAASIYGDFMPGPGGGIVPVPPGDWPSVIGVESAGALPTFFGDLTGEVPSLGSNTSDSDHGETLESGFGDDNEILWTSGTA